MPITRRDFVKIALAAIWGIGAAVVAFRRLSEPKTEVIEMSTATATMLLLKKKKANRTLLSNFVGPGDDVAITRVTSSGVNDLYGLHQHIGNGMYWSLEFYNQAWTTITNTSPLYYAKIKRIAKWFNSLTTPAVTFSGGWNNSTVAGYMGNKTYYVDAAGAYAEIVYPAGATWHGVEHITATSRGLMVVSVDGSLSAADLLPTAQSVVDNGAYANTILVENGGTLNPTDRVIDCYGAGGYAQTIISKSLSATSHTVRLTRTGYKRAASTGTNIGINAFFAHGPSYCKMSDTNYYLLAEQTMMTTTYTWEISWNIIPTGGVSQWWVGHAGSMKFLSMDISIDGVVTTIADGQTKTGVNNVVFTLQSSVRATEIGGGATQIGVLNMIYTLNSVTGLTIDHNLTWELGGVLQPSFPCMHAVDKILDRGRADAETVETLASSDNSLKCKTSKYTLYAWDYDGYMATAFSPDPVIACGNWANNADSNNRFFWKDMVGMNKAYVLPRSGTLTYSIGDIFTSRANYRAAWLAQGANVVLGS
jgi:hypothetical protein